LLADVQQAVWSMSASLPLANVRTLQEIYDKSLARNFIHAGPARHRGRDGPPDRNGGNLRCDLLRSLQRRREIRIRIALGARRPRADAHVHRPGFVLALIGVGCGLAGRQSP